MKPKTQRSPKSQAPAAAAAPRRRPGWPLYALAGAALVLMLWAYAPSLHGPFLFDDTALPFALPRFDSPLMVWLRSPRPVLYLTYWINARLSGSDPASYHAFNLVFHALSTLLLFLIVRRLLEWSGAEKGRRDLLALFAAGVFLLHPLQTEAVAYLAGRSDGLSTLLVFAAYAVFLYRRHQQVTWWNLAALVPLTLAALLAKESAVVLPALFLLTDFWWNPGFSLEGIRRNWRLYGVLALGGAAAIPVFWTTLQNAQTAGFALKDLTWYQYFFTQCRALFVYVGLFLFPAGQDADWDFPISPTVFAHGAIVGLIALIALAALAWRYRRRYPLAAFGFFAYLLLMAPTSSILPIRDPVAERRIYLSMLGLLLIAVEFVGRVRWDRNRLAAATAAVVLVLAAATHARAQVWSSDLALWEDTVQKSPAKARAHFHLASAYYDQGQCGKAVDEYQRTAQLQAPTYGLLVNWALAYDCASQPQRALEKLKQAAAIDRTEHVYTQMAKVYADTRQWPQALEALDAAARINPASALVFAYRGKVHFATNEMSQAIEDYRRALALDPLMGDPPPTGLDVRQDLAKAQALAASRR